LLSEAGIGDGQTRARELPRWTGYLGVVTAGLIGMFRNVTDVVDPVREVNNYLLPVWMIVFGAGLLRYRSSASLAR
jgi:hypothetical protein